MHLDGLSFRDVVLIWQAEYSGALKAPVRRIGKHDSGAAEPPVRKSESHYSGLSEPPLNTIVL